MRAHKLLALVDKIEQEAQNRPIDASLDAWVKLFGASAAAWLVFSHKRQFVRRGIVDFKLPKKVEKPPPWFRIAIETLKRSEKWNVVHLLTPTEKIFRVTWRGGRHEHGIPSAAVTA